MEQEQLRIAFAKVFVRHRVELIDIIRKYDSSINLNSSSNKILETVFDLIENNINFNKDLVAFMQLKKYIYVGSDKYRNWIELIAPAVQSLAEMVGSITQRPNRKDRLAEYQMAQMEMIKAEEERKAKEQRTKLMIAGGVGIGLIVLTIFIVKMNKK